MRVGLGMIWSGGRSWAFIGAPGVDRLPMLWLSDRGKRRSQLVPTLWPPVTQARAAAYTSSILFYQTWALLFQFRKLHSQHFHLCLSHSTLLEYLLYIPSSSSSSTALYLSLFFSLLIISYYPCFILTLVLNAWTRAFYCFVLYYSMEENLSFSVLLFFLLSPKATYCSFST